MGADGTTLDQRRSPRGLMAVEGGRFSEALEEVAATGSPADKGCRS